MGPSVKMLFFRLFLYVLPLVKASIYNVKITTETYINEVDPRFLSFTVDPKYLFGNDENFNRQECLCMASVLKPAFLRIAGPSTSKMILQNSTITFTDLDEVFNKKKEENLKKLKVTSKENDVTEEKYDPTYDNTDQDNKPERDDNIKNDINDKERHKRKTKDDSLAVTYYQWKKFVDWAKDTGFDLVFALNHEEKLNNGLWDPHPVLDVLTLAEKANVGDMYWQLGYECKNQTLEDYFNDLETLRVIVETFPEGDKWRTVGSDVTHCLAGHSKSDFKDYVILSDDNMDAIILNGNSSAAELNKLPEKDRLSLLKRLSDSSTPLWLTESQSEILDSGLERASQWMLSLGFAAQNGFTVHFRELVERELYEPTLSFYMALLYKNLVGPRVLNVDMEASQTVVFAHCTSLRHQPVSGAVTLYAVNMDEEPARIAIKLTNREKGGDVMQFILGSDSFGNILVNGRVMQQNGDINPIVKRVRPYKTLLISLPPKSFGFWILANTNVEACKHVEDIEEAASAANSRTKRYVDCKKGNEHLSKEFLNEKDGLKKRLVNLNEDFNSIHRVFKRKSEAKRGLLKVKRQVEEQERRKPLTRLRSERNRIIEEFKPRTEFLKKLRNFGYRLNFTRPKADRRKWRFNKSLKNTRSSKLRSKPVTSQDIVVMDTDLNRRKRSLVLDKQKNAKDFEHSFENEIDVDGQEEKLYKILKKIHKDFKDMPLEEDGSNQSDSRAIEDEIVVKTKLSDDVSSINIREKSKKGLLKSTISKVTDVLGDLNDNLNRFWDLINVLD